MSGKTLINSMVAFSRREYDDFQMHLSSMTEWPGINISVDKGKLHVHNLFRDGTICRKDYVLIQLIAQNCVLDLHATLNIPMLIMELYRLIPYKEDRYVHFHPFNMPHIKSRMEQE
ncbi:hypothetical protein EAI_00133 [Harpegnathos saltator]|uniref:Uncharacterized protein n=1 Tax=Harpegnathos saltator TaxID=610380 RepID=E2BXR6_HARSA|nr:hypothetical protein EAI_00133 [Harpegnathos saltator]